MAILSEFSLWLLPLCLLIGASYSFLLYYKNFAIEFEKKSLIVMAILRGLTIALIAFLILAPMTKLTIKETHKPVLLFAIDNSESIISGKDSTYYRTDFIEQMNHLVSSFSKKYDVDVMLVGDQNQYLQFEDNKITPDFSDKSSNLSVVFDDITTLYSDRNVGAMVLFTDGIYNVGNNPLYKAKTLPFPVYTVGLGNTVTQTDLLIAGINHNKQVYKGNKFQVELKIAANKLQGNSSKVTVENQQKEVLFSKNINITSGQYFETISLSLEAKDKGLHQYRVILDNLEGEITYKNNSASFFIEVVDSREKIAIIYHAPHPDIAALKSGLEAIDKYQVESFTIQDFKNRPEEYSLLILHQLPSSKSISLPLINNASKAGVSTLFILGDMSDLQQFNNINTGIRITQNKNLFNNSTPSFNDNFTSFTFSEETRNLLKNFPPLHTFFGEYKSSVSSNIFLYQKINSVVSSYPLFVFNDINNLKTGVITGIGLWQWKLHNYQITGNFDAFNEIVGKTVQFLSVKNDKSFFRVNTKQLFNENENVVFDASLFNDSYELINEPDIELVLNNPANNTYDYRFSKKDLAYELDLGQLPPGDYKWQASTKLGNKGYAKNGQFTVREMLMETTNLVADHDLLQMISNATKGNFYLPQELNQIEQVIKDNDYIKPVVSYQKNYKMMLNSPIYFIIIILLFGVEWFLRKWGGAY